MIDSPICTWVAFVLSCSALISGIMAIGSGRDWHFTTMDILRGRDNAIAYIWVVLSTIFSIAHVVVIGFWISIQGFVVVTPAYLNLWMLFHSGVGALFLTAHLFVKQRLKSQRGMPVTYLWGNK